MILCSLIKKDFHMYGLGAVFTIISIGVSLAIALIYMLIVWGVSRKSKKEVHPIAMLPLLILAIATLVFVSQIPS